MSKSASPLGQLAAVTPATTDAPDVQGDLANLVKLVELKLLLVFTTRTARDAAFTAASQSPVDGMECQYTSSTDAGEIDKRIAGAWVKVYPLTYSGTGTPSSGQGVNGNVYYQTS